MRAIQIKNHGEQLKENQCLDLFEGDTDILITVKAAGVNPVDTYIVGGTNGYTATFPHTPGKDGAGVIAALGAKVTGFKVVNGFIAQVLILGPALS